MRITRFLGLGAIAALPLGFAGAAGAAEPIAIVYSLTGKASFAPPYTGRRSLRLGDRLPAGTTLEAGPRSRLELAFINGLRYELGAHSRARLGPRGLASRTGLVRPLPTTPPLPGLSPISARDRPGRRAGALRIRSESIAGLYPDHGATALAQETILRFQPVAGTPRYRVEVRDDQGRAVFSTETAGAEVRVPAGVLQPGLRYSWQVSTVERAGPVARGEAEIVTLPRQIAEAREALRKAAGEAAAGVPLALLAEVDRGLGLLAEAREELRAALRESPGDAALEKAFADLDRRLQEEP
ncbi:MAG TPA: hypothetical protein VIC28_01975 [Thermoanaerobaculia bacterium]|jgi:hypothetical protein